MYTPKSYFKRSPTLETSIPGSCTISPRIELGINADPSVEIHKRGGMRMYRCFVLSMEPWESPEFLNARRNPKPLNP